MYIKTCKIKSIILYISNIIDYICIHKGCDWFDTKLENWVNCKVVIYLLKSLILINS